MSIKDMTFDTSYVFYGSGHRLSGLFFYLDKFRDKRNRVSAPAICSKIYWNRRTNYLVFGKINIYKQPVGDTVCMYGFFSKYRKRLCYSFKSYDFITEKICLTSSDVRLQCSTNQPLWWLFLQPEVFVISKYEVS